MQHIAIIMDGNGRWAKSRLLPRFVGHRKGMKTIKTIVEHTIKKEIKYLTLYAFSTENWRRPQKEINSLMDILDEFMNTEITNLINNGIKLHISGKLDKFSLDIQKKIENCIIKSQNNTTLNLCIALNYGSRSELTHACKKIAQQIINKQITIEDINEDLISNNLFSKEIPDPDLIIRTGGEQRISNFLLWQSAYSELYFTTTLWPDFNSDELDKAIIDYNKRTRNYGSILDPM